MPNVQVKIDAKGIQRHTDWTYNPGRPTEVTTDGREVNAWIDHLCNVPLTIPQAETMGDLVTEGITDENGNVTRVMP